MKLVWDLNPHANALANGKTVRIKVFTDEFRPRIEHYENVVLGPCKWAFDVVKGDIVLCKLDERYKLKRVAKVTTNTLVLDSGDEIVLVDQANVFGKVIAQGSYQSKGFMELTSGRKVG